MLAMQPSISAQPSASAMAAIEGWWNLAKSYVAKPALSPNQLPNQLPAQAATPAMAQPPARQYPKQSSGQYPRQYPGQSPGQYPGQSPGQYPGQSLGQYPKQSSGQYSSQHQTPDTHAQPSNNGNMAVLAERVETATRTMPSGPTAPGSQAPLSVDDAFARMKAVTQIRPRTADEVDRKSPEYAFGETFSGMVQHIVTGYLDKAVVPIIHQTIMSEIDRLASHS